MFYYMLFFVFILVTRYSTVRQLAFLLESYMSESEQRRGPAPAVPEGAIKRQNRLRNMSQKWGCARRMESAYMKEGPFF